MWKYYSMSRFYREFTSNSGISSYGSISVVPHTDGTMSVSVLNIHAFIEYDDYPFCGGEAWIRVKYPMTANVFDIVHAIFDKITQDYGHDFAGIPYEYQDFLCAFERCNYNSTEKDVMLTDLNRNDPISFVEYTPYPVFEMSGEVLENGVFTYDYPLRNNEEYVVNP